MRGISQDALRRLLGIHRSYPEHLTRTEQELCARICECARCGYLWVRHIKKYPTRCVDCGSTHWDKPTVLAIVKVPAPPVPQPQ